MAIYIFKKSLNTAAGRFEFMFLFGLFLFQLTSASRCFEFKFLCTVPYLMQIVEITPMFSCTLVLSIDIWSTFR